MSENQNESTIVERPRIISVICILGSLGIAYVLILFLANSSVVIQKLGVMSVIYYVAVDIILRLIALVGYWKMQRWGVCIYLVVTVLGFFFPTNSPQEMSFNFFEIAYLIIGMVYFRRMT